MNARLLATLLVVIFIVSCYSINPYILNKAKKHLAEQAFFVYLNKTNKINSLRPIREYSYLNKMKELYLGFDVNYLNFKHTEKVKKPDKVYVKIEVHYNNGTVAKYDLSDKVSINNPTSDVDLNTTNYAIQVSYLEKDSSIIANFNISVFILYLNVGKYPFLVNLSGNVDYYTINVTLCKSGECSTNVIDVNFDSNKPIYGPFLGQLNYLSSSGNYYKFNLSLPRVGFVKINNPNIKDLFLLGLNETDSKNITIPSSLVSSFVKINGNTYLMYESKVALTGVTRTGVGYGFVAICSDPDASGYYNVLISDFENINSILCNPTYLTTTIFSYNFVNVPKFVSHNNEKEPLYEVRKIVILPKDYCVTSHWVLMVVSKTLIKKPPYLYLKYTTNTGNVIDKSEVLPNGLTAYENLLSSIDVSSTTKQKIFEFWTQFKKNTYGYLYTDVIPITPEILVDHDNQCVLVFNYSFSLFGVKPSEVSIFLLNLNKDLLKNSLIINTLILRNDLKQGFLRIIEGQSKENLYVYSVSVEPYPTSLNNENLYVFKFTPVIRKKISLFGPTYVVPMYLVSELAITIAGIGTYLGKASDYALKNFEKTHETVSNVQEELANEEESLFNAIGESESKEIIGADIFLSPEFMYNKLFGGDNAIYKVYYKIYKQLIKNEELREEVFNNLRGKILTDTDLKKVFEKAFGEDFINNLNSGNYVECLMDMFEVNNKLELAMPKFQNYLKKEDEFDNLIDTIENAFGKGTKIDPEFSNLLEYSNLKVGFNIPNLLVEGESETTISEFYNSFATANSKSDLLNNVFKKIIAICYRKWAERDVPDILKAFLNKIVSKLDEITITSVSDLDKIGVIEFIKEKFSSVKLSNLAQELKEKIFEPVVTAKYTAKGETVEECSSKISDEAEELSTSVEQEINQIVQSEEEKSLPELLSRIFKIPRVLYEHPTAMEIIGRGITGVMYGFAAFAWLWDLFETEGYVNHIIHEWQQLYNYNISHAEGYLPVVLVNFEGQSFPVPILFNISWFHNISYQTHVKLLGLLPVPCAISNLKSFGGLFVGNASTLSSINQYLPPMGMLPDFYTKPPNKDKISNFMAKTKEGFDIGMFFVSAVSAGLSIAGFEVSTLPVLGFLMANPIGIVAVIAASIIIGYLFKCTNLFYIPYHQFLKLLGVKTFVINSQLLKAKEQKIGKFVNPEKPLIEFYLNNSSFEKLLKQICIYGYLGKWNSTSHICFAGALFNNTPYLSYVDNNSSFYYGPIPSRVLLDSGDVYVGILSLPMALTERIDDHEYTYSNKELFELLNAIWSYFKKPNHPNLGLFINWVEENPNLDKNYGLMAILAAKQKDKYNIMAYLIAGACLGYVVQDFGINNNQNIDKAVCENFVSKCLPSYVEILNNLTTIKEKGKYAPLLSGNPTSPIATTNNTKIEFSNNISVRAFNSTDYIVYAPLIVLYARMTSNDEIQKIEFTYKKGDSVSKTFTFPIYRKTVSIYLDVIGQDSKGYFHSVASDLYNDPSSPIPKSRFKLITIDGQKVPVLPVVIYNITNTSINNFNFPLQYLYYIGKSNNFNINVTKQIEYLVVGHNKYYGIFKTIFNTKDVLTNQGIPDYWPKESQTAPVIKPRPNFIIIVPPDKSATVEAYLTSSHSYQITEPYSYISAGLLAKELANIICSDNLDVCKLMLRPGKFGLSTNVLALVKNNKIELYAMKGFVGFNSPSYWKKFEVLKPSDSFYDLDLKSKGGGVCVLWWCSDKVTYPPTFELIDKPYEFQGYFEVQVLVPKTELTEMLTYCSSKYKNCKIALIAIPS